MSVPFAQTHSPYLDEYVEQEIKIPLATLRSRCTECVLVKGGHVAREDASPGDGSPLGLALGLSDPSPGIRRRVGRSRNALG